ncbi:hypothetical protein AMS68_005586 [Peltaster fructicola]|uniref:Probable methionine--tRNA ligase, mitochondrial n=1 Tax=Peltaster fructicola TaxID=286661 RepID=A0A6H0XZM9_9PEZI|nr:hypothetical protein AMS68_005586 [Peltaster fructicola]
MVLTDVLKRWQELKGRKAILCTGTDEHGLKMQQAAAKAEMEPQALCDQNAQTFQDLAASIGISNDIFIRTTDKRHREAVEYAWQMLQERGYIYESKHEGWYSVSDETFYPPSQVQLIVDPPTGRKIMTSIETGKEVEWTSERNYHFRLSAFREKLLAWYASNPAWIVPKARMEDVVQQVSENLEDLSISRPVSRLTWGIQVPNDASQTIYVWLDALLNYATAAGYPFTPGNELEGGWPADIHVIGKDIVRFHCIYWPAFLMALNLPLPKQILTHAHWTLGKQKMAKSTGNVVNPFWALDRFGMDALRWYLIHDGGIEDDADYDNDFIVAKYKKGLQGGLGNLTSRITRGRGWDVRRAVQHFAGHPKLIYENADEPMKHFCGNLRSALDDTQHAMNQLLPNKALQRIMKLIYDANGYIQHHSPWLLVSKLQAIAADTTGQSLHDLGKEGQSAESLEADIDRTIYLCAESLRIAGIMLQAFIPDSAKRLLDMLGVADNRRTVEWCESGKDTDYGTPMVELGKGEKGVLFPALICDR